MKPYFARRWRWIATAPRDLLVLIAVAVTWLGWYQVQHGRTLERRWWEQFRNQVAEEAANESAKECAPTFRRAHPRDA